MSTVHQSAAANAATDLIENIRVELSPIGWQTLLAVLLTIYRDGTPEGRRVVYSELQRMAAIADIGNEALKVLDKLAAEVAHDEQAQTVLTKARQLASPGSVAEQSVQSTVDQPGPAKLDQAMGLLAQQAGKQLPIEICYSAAGFYIGTYDERGPCTRESVEYWPRRESAQSALDRGEWTQRTQP